MRIALVAWMSIVVAGTVAVNCGSSTTRRTLPGEGGQSGAEASAPGGEPGVGATGGTLATPAGGHAGDLGSGGAPEVSVAGEAALAGAAGAAEAAGATDGGQGGQGGSGTVVVPGQLFNTGVGDDGIALPGGSVDPHYRLIQSAESTLPGPNAIVTSKIADGYWVPQTPTSKWIAPSENQSYPGATPCNASGDYVYRTTFVLTAEQVSTFKIVGQWGADNYGSDILLNGTSLGLKAPSYNPLTAFTVTSGFMAGENTLDFKVNDIGCPNGLRVELTAGTQ